MKNFIKKNLVGLGLFAIAAAGVIIGFLIYKSSKNATQALATATTGTQGVNQFAGDADAFLKQIGVFKS